MLSAPGSVVAGSSTAIPTSRPKPAGRSTSIIGDSKANRSARAISSSALTRRPPSRHASASIPPLKRLPLKRLPLKRCVSSTSMSVAGHWPSPGRLGRSPCEALWSLRALYRHRTIRSSPRAGHERGALQLSRSRILGIVDNGSSHRGQTSIDRLQGAFSNLMLIHLPVHASWLNQIEIYFSVVQRKVLTPNDFSDLAEVEARLLAFQDHYERVA